MILISFLSLYFYEISRVAQASPAGHQIKVVNFIDDFIEYYKKSESLPIDKKIQLWSSQYERLDPELFDTFLYKRASSKGDAIQAALLKYPEKMPLLTGIRSRIVGLVENDLKVFQEDFHEIKLKLDLVFLPGDFSLGGMSTKYRGKPFLIVCPEMAQDLNGIRRLIIHELFHAFHNAANKNNEGDERIEAWILQEGLAVYFESLHGPDWQPQSIFPGSPKEQREYLQQTEAREAKLIKLLESDIGKRDRTTRVNWIGISRHHDVIPPAAGYYLGYLVVKKLRQSLSIAEIVQLHDVRLTNMVRQSLHTMM